MYLCMCKYICICIYIYVHMYICVSMCTHTPTYSRGCYRHCGTSGNTTLGSTLSSWKYRRPPASALVSVGGLVLVLV